MAVKTINPYLNFTGNAAQAIELYESALGAKIEQISRFGDAAGMPIAPEHKNMVMHAMLQIGGGVVMLSDVPPGMPVASESNTHVALHFDDEAETTKRFQALAAGARSPCRSRTRFGVPNSACSPTRSASVGCSTAS